MRSYIAFLTALFAVFIIALYNNYDIQSSIDSPKSCRVTLSSFASLDFDYPAGMLSINAGRSVNTLSTRPANHRSKHFKFFTVNYLAYRTTIAHFEQENKLTICNKNDLFAQPNLNLRLQVIRI